MKRKKIGFKKGPFQQMFFSAGTTASSGGATAKLNGIKQENRMQTSDCRL